MNFSHSLLQSSAPVPLRATPNVEGWSFARLWEILRRRIGFPVLATLCALVAAMLYVSMTPALYTATAALITDTKRPSASPAEVTNEGIVDAGLADSQIELLKSETLAARVIKDLDLTSDPEFLNTSPGWTTRALQAIGLAEDRQVSDQDKVRLALPAFKRGLKVLRIGRSYVTEISYTSLDPKKAATISNAVAQAYIQDQLSARFSNLQRAGAWMTEHIDDLRRRADDADRALRAFKATAPTAASVDQKASNQQATEAQEPSRGVPAAPIADANAQVRLQQLEADAQVKRSAYENMANRSTRITQFIQQQSFPYTDARVITEATPPFSKSSPRTGLTLLLATLAGGMIGLAAAFGRDQLDRGIGAGRLERELGVRTFGPLGAGSPAATLGRGEAAESSSKAHWADEEILLGLKAVIDRGLAAGKFRSIGTLSSCSGDGRQILAAQLAVLLGRSGRRVLLIDGDLRAGSLTRLLTPQPSKGLVDVLVSPVAIADALIATPGGFAFLGAGEGLRGAHPSDWLGSPAMADLMERLHNEFDCILIDLPAMLEFVDVTVCDGLADAFVMIADARRETVDDVRRALDSADRVADRLIGVVVKQGRAGGLGSYF